MIESCEHCPCPEICLRREAWCEALRRNSNDEQMRRHIVGRSRIGETPHQHPSLGRQALNLAGAIGRITSAVAQGVAIKVTEDVYAKRLAICLPCEFNSKRGQKPDAVRCTKCGCGGAKLYLATEACPVGKWAASSET